MTKVNSPSTVVARVGVRFTPLKGVLKRMISIFRLGYWIF
ncbi:hypothetical protein SPONN_1043 [uncultured Candidatus Thioglobus sp.]|nr:hypothetical protein SPONN_1043 [uncultured Candidatus Thioglobus sp.]